MPLLDGDLLSLKLCVRPGQFGPIFRGELLLVLGRGTTRGRLLEIKHQLRLLSISISIYHTSILFGYAFVTWEI